MYLILIVNQYNPRCAHLPIRHRGSNASRHCRYLFEKLSLDLNSKTNGVEIGSTLILQLSTNYNIVSVADFLAECAKTNFREILVDQYKLTSVCLYSYINIWNEGGLRSRLTLTEINALFPHWSTYPRLILLKLSSENQLESVCLYSYEDHIHVGWLARLSLKKLNAPLPYQSIYARLN